MLPAPEEARDLQVVQVVLLLVGLLGAPLVVTPTGVRSTGRCSICRLWIGYEPDWR